MKRVYVAGHLGMVGSAVVRRLQDNQQVSLVLASRDELDLRNQAQVADFFASTAIDEVYLCAAKVGGIAANDLYPAEFIFDNLSVECNVIHSAYVTGVKKLLFLGSSCIYPKFSRQPISEDELLTGHLEQTNEPYAIAKIAGIKLCESYNRQYGVDFRSAMPTNLYGPNDNFHPVNSHVLPALLSRFHEARIAAQPEVVVWGSGNARREFMHVDDLASALVHLMSLGPEPFKQHTKVMQSHVNIGTGVDCSIKELASLIKDVTGYQGRVIFDTSKPDGTPRKLLDVRRLHAMGWQASISLSQGLADTYTWYLQNIQSARH